MFSTTGQRRAEASGTEATMTFSKDRLGTPFILVKNDNPELDPAKREFSIQDPAEAADYIHRQTTIHDRKVNLDVENGDLGMVFDVCSKLRDSFSRNQDDAKFRAHSLHMNLAEVIPDRKGAAIDDAYDLVVATRALAGALCHFPRDDQARQNESARAGGHFSRVDHLVKAQRADQKNAQTLAKDGYTLGDPLPSGLNGSLARQPVRPPPSGVEMAKRSERVVGAARGLLGALGVKESTNGAPISARALRDSLFPKATDGRSTSALGPEAATSKPAKV